MNEMKMGAALSYIVIAVNIVVGILYTPFMLRMLGAEEYGLYSLANSVIAYLTLLDLGFGNAIIRYTSKFRVEGKIREQSEMFGMFMRVYLIVGLLALLVGAGLVVNIEALFSGSMSGGEIDKLRILMILMAFNLAFTFPLSIYGSIIIAYEKFIFPRVISIIRLILNPVVMTIVLIFGYKSIALVIVTTLFNLITLLFNRWFCRKRLNIKILYTKFNWSLMREVSIYSFWIFLNIIMDKIYWSSGQFILGIYKGSVAVAVYSIAIYLQSFYMMFSTAISGVFLPRVTAMVASGRSEREVSDLFIRTGRVQYIIMAFILTGFTLFGRSFVTLWAGEEYSEAYTMALIFLVPLTVPLIQNLGITILQARNQLKFRSILYISIALLSLLLAILLTPRYGGIGCAIATASALLLGQIIIMNIYYKRSVAIDIPRFWREIGGMSIAPAIILVIGYYIMQEVEIVTIGEFLLSTIIFSIVYLPAFWHLSMNHSERELFITPIRKFINRATQ